MADFEGQLLLQIQQQMTEGFARMATAKELGRVEGKLDAYQKDTDRRLEKLEVAQTEKLDNYQRLTDSRLDHLEDARAEQAGATALGRRAGSRVAFAVSTAALWAAVVVALLRH